MKNMGVPDFKSFAEIHADGRDNTIIKKSLQLNRDAIYQKGPRWKSGGEATFTLPPNGVAQVRLEGGWSHNVGGYAVTPIPTRGNPFKSMINDIITIPKIY